MSAKITPKGLKNDKHNFQINFVCVKLPKFLDYYKMLLPQSDGKVSDQCF